MIFAPVHAHSWPFDRARSIPLRFMLSERPYDGARQVVTVRRNKWSFWIALAAAYLLAAQTV